ncbi:hypothetical protein [Solirubrum puertoriconensis]|nr:hypothetical protein [Solirubrum puertoriconensis]
MQTQPNPDAEQPASEQHNISARELDRDIINLHLPEPESYVATEDELIKLYGADFYNEMMKMGSSDD